MTDSQALDEVFGILNSLLPTLNAVVGYTIDVRWQGAAQSSKPDQSKFWFRVSTQVVTQKQATLSNANGQKRFHSVCLLYVQVFAPRLVPNSVPNGRSIATAIRDQYRKVSTSSDVWFRDAKVVELPPDDEHYIFNSVVTFEYDEVIPVETVIPDLGLPPNSKPHDPVETPDGIIQLFTFPGLPLFADQYAIVVNGIISSVTQTGNQVDLGYAPVLGDQVIAYF